MNFNDTVEKVLALLKEKDVCWSSRKSHRECYSSLDTFLRQKGVDYSEETREQWFSYVKDSLPNQRYVIWVKYVFQLEEMDATDTISDRHLYLNVSYYERLPVSWKRTLDIYLEECRTKYTDRTLELTRIYCSEGLQMFVDLGINELSEITYDSIISMIDREWYVSSSKRFVILQNVSRMLFVFSERDQCSKNFSLLFDGYLYPHIGKLTEFSDCNKRTLEMLRTESLKRPADDFYNTIIPFVDALKSHGYVGTTLYTARHMLTVLFLFLEVHGFGFHLEIMWCWFAETKQKLGSSWLHWRRILKMYEEYIIFGDIQTAGKYQYQPSSFEQLPEWCREPVNGLLEQKRREFRKGGTIRTYMYSCIRFCRYLITCGYNSFSSLSPSVIKAYANQDKHETFNGRTTSFLIIRALLRYLDEYGYTEMHGLEGCLISGTAPEEKIVDILTDDQIQRINDFRATHKEPVELRDIAIVLLGLRMGFRAADVLALRFCDIDWKKRQISIVMKKTETQITLPMPVDVGNAIYSYIVFGRPDVGGDYIFIRSKAPYGTLTGKVCTKALYRILPERKEIKGGGFHVTRRTFATNLLRNRAGIDDVIDALGHNNSTSVMSYLLLDEERTRKCGLSLKDAGLLMEVGLTCR